MTRVRDVTQIKIISFTISYNELAINKTIKVIDKSIMVILSRLGPTTQQNQILGTVRIKKKV